MFDIFKYAIENPKSVISQSVFRIRRICNRANCVLINISGGKDSSLDFDLFMNEIEFRRSTKTGKFEITSDDFENFSEYYKLEDTNKNEPFIVVNTLDPEIIYTDTRNHIIYDKILPYGFGLFIVNDKIICGYDPIKIDCYDNYYSYWKNVKDMSEEIDIDNLNNIDPIIVERVKNGIYNKPRKYKDVICLIEGKGIIHTFYKCLPIAFQDVSAFSNESGFVSWNKDKKDYWVTEIPKREVLGCDPITEENWENKNIIPISLCPKWFNSKIINYNGIKCYQNWGFGSNLLNRKLLNIKNNRVCGWSYFAQEDEGNKMSEVYTFSSWLLDSVPETVKNIYVEDEIEHPFDFYSIVSIRAEESPNRNIILKQSNYYNGQYGYISRDSQTDALIK